MKRLILTLALLLGVAQLSIVNCQLSIGTRAQAQVPYGYAPEGAANEELSALGIGNKSGFVQGMALFDPQTDAVLGRMKGQQIRGVRCYLRADYKQAKQKRSAILASTGSVSNIVRTTYADFTEGWNDVLFDEPLVIGDEPIFLGLQVYETVGTPYPLVTFAAATVPQSCLVNLSKSKWEEYTDRGTLLVSALVDESQAPQFSRAAYAQNTTHPQTVAPDRDFTGGLYIHNCSQETIRDVEIAMQGEGATAPTYLTLQLPSPLPPLGSTVVTARLRAGLTEGTSVAWTANVTRINGEEAQTARPGTTRLYVTYDDFQRTPLIEEFTSQRCVNCPQMAYFLDKALEEYGPNYVYVSHHTGFAEDVFTTQPDREVLYFFGGYANEYNPAIMYNRAILEGESNVIQGVRDMSPAPYLTALALASAMPAMAEVNVEEEGDQVRVYGRVARDLVGQPLYLSCYLVEDGISVDKYYQKGMDDADAPADLADVFRHNGIILHYYTTEALGDQLSVGDNGAYSISYPAVTKQGFGGTRRRLVAFIHKVDKENIRENQVLNATQTILGTDGIRAIEDNDVLEKSSGNAGQRMKNEFYDLAGRRVTKPVKGLYIKGGRKHVLP
ncbi:MAG: hypothetical protein IJ064_03295 [Bacteroidaceae bacterium]|nr:hypothetical protein [Bacteroidaceae bacterium]